MNVPPTRQELLILKKKVKVAKRSKKLLEDKRNSLIKRFMEVIDEAIVARESFETSYTKAYKLFNISKSVSDDSYYDLLPKFSNSKLELDTTKNTTLGVALTKINLANSHFEVNYSKLATNQMLDEALELLKKSIEDMTKTLELEYTARKLSEEIIKTRRRVNALEYVIVPRMESNAKEIAFKLSELEQSTKVMLMRVKANMG